MSFHSRRFATVAVLITAIGIGCHHNHRHSCNTCSTDCNSCDEDGPKRWSDEWYCQEANSPTGARQACHHGVLWPPFARPTGKKQQWSHRFHTAHYWPYPYDTQDLAYLRQVSATQVANGWQTETTLYAYHFDAENNTLNQAGLLHLKWIIQIAPVQRRHVWIQKSDDETVNAVRLASVKLAATKFACDGDVPPIDFMCAPTDGRPTNEINNLRGLEFGSMPKPRITGSSGSGSAGGSGSGAPSGSP